MNTLQCEMCIQLLSPDRMGEPAASLVKANEAAEMLNPVYVYCEDCKHHLCKRCDYRTHVSSGNMDSSDSEADHLHHRFQKRTISHKCNEDSKTQDMEAQIGLNYCKNKTESPQKTNTKAQPNSADKLACSSPNSMQQEDQNSRAEASSTQNNQSTTMPTQSQDVTSTQDHQRIQVCEECLEKHSHAFCPKCEQALCQKCWEKIHNKGARARHRQKSLQRPKFYPPNTWRKTSLTNQQSEVSSSQQDSLSQYKQEHVLLDDGIIFEDHKDRTERSAMLGTLQVQLVDRQAAQIAASTPQDLQGDPSAQFQIQSAGQHPPQYEHLMYGQSPSFIPSHQNKPPQTENYMLQQQYEYSHSNQRQQQAQFPMNASPFQPQMQMHPIPNQFARGGHPSQHYSQSQQQYYMYPGPPPHDQSQAMHNQYANNPQYAGGPPIFSSQQQHQMQQQQLFPRQGSDQRFPEQPHFSDVSSRMFPLHQKQQAYQPLGDDQNFQTRNAHSQQSEDELSLDTGIHDEARHQVPTAFIELESGALHHHDYRHGNQSSEAYLLNRHVSKNQQKNNAEGANHENLNSAQSQKFEAYGGSNLQGSQKRGPGSNNMSAYEQLPAGSKAFTPLRKGLQSTSESIPSPLLSTPNEQLRIGGYKNSKQMTPPIPIGTSQRQAELKLKVGGTSQYVGKASKPLKVPRDHRAYNNAHSNLQGYSYGGKPPIGTDKKGPHIQYQAKTGKPNSLSSHEMNSDNEGEGVHYQAKPDQRSFDAYQLGHQSSSSAKGNPRSQHNLPYGGGSFLPRKNPSQHNTHDYSPRSQHSHNSHNSGHNQDSQNMRLRGTRNQNQYHQQTYGGDTNSSGGYNERAQKVNTQTGFRNASRGSGNKAGSQQSTYKSGSGSASTGNGNKATSSSNQNLRSTPSRANQHEYHRINLSLAENVPIFQPVIKLPDNTGSRGRGTMGNSRRSANQMPEESKSGYHSHSSSVEENELMTRMQHILFQNAALGDLLILKTKFMDQIHQMLKVPESTALQAIDKAVSLSIIHQTDRNFANSQKIEFVSLKIQVLSHQCLQWVITSLRRDEMTPTDSAIKNRTKEAFDFKLQNDQWEAIMKSIQIKQNGNNRVSNDATSMPGQRNNQSDSSHHQQPVLRKSITPPDKGSSAQTHMNAHTRLVGMRNSQNNIDSSFITQSSAGSSSQHQQMQAMQTTATTVSAQGITKIIKHSAMTEADTGSGSTLRNRPGGNASSVGEATGSSDPAIDSHPSSSQQPAGEMSSSAHSNSNNAADVVAGGMNLPPMQRMVAPRFKVVLLNGEDSSAQTSQSAGGAAGSGAEGGSSGNAAAQGGSVIAIYMEDEQVWTGVDIEDDSTVDRSLYQIMKEFLRQYFCKPDDNSIEKEGGVGVQDLNGNLMTPSGQGNSEDYTLQGGENLRMIPGGRYGCTQFLKICGPEEIRKCSVGKTTQMVQLAIKEDVLRHLKTQIVWSTQVDKHKTEQDTLEDQQILVQRKAKLEKVKEAIIEILAESKTGPKTGMSLAQLPQYLKKKLPFNLDWNELGFPKLKDLLQSMTDQIIVELRDVNHPFAYLVHHKQRSANQSGSGHQNKICMDKLMFRENDAQSEQNPDRSSRQMVYDSEKLSQIVQAVFTLLQMYPQGIKEINLREYIQNQINFEFSFIQLGCGSEYEFVQKYIMPKDDSIEFITMQGNNGQKTFNIRSNKILRQFFNQHVQEQIVNQDAKQYQEKKDHNSMYPSSMSHKNFNRGPRVNNHTNSSVPSDFSSSEQWNQDGHQQRIQTQPNDRRMPPFSLQQAYFQTCESIHGSDSQSYDSSTLHHQVKAISDLSKSIQLDFQESATAPPFTQQAQPLQHNHKFNQQISKAQKTYANPWQQVSGQGFSKGVFDDLKVPSNIHGAIAQTPFGNPSLMAGSLCIPIDQDDHNQAQVPQQQLQQQQETFQAMFHPNQLEESDSPRVQEIIQHQLFGDSPTGHDEFYPQQQNQNMANDSVSQNNFSMSDGGIMNQSIFSADFNRIPRSKNFQMEQAGHHSVDLNDNLLNSRAHPSSQEEYFPLLLTTKKMDDQVTSKTWQPPSNLSKQLDIRQGGMNTKPAPVLIPQSIYHLQHQASFHGEEEKQRITEETSESHHSSTPKTPEQLGSNILKPMKAAEQNQSEVVAETQLKDAKYSDVAGTQDLSNKLDE